MLPTMNILRAPGVLFYIYLNYKLSMPGPSPPPSAPPSVLAKAKVEVEEEEEEVASPSLPSLRVAKAPEETIRVGKKKKIYRTRKKKKKRKIEKGIKIF